MSFRLFLRFFQFGKLFGRWETEQRRPVSNLLLIKIGISGWSSALRSPCRVVWLFVIEILAHRSKPNHELISVTVHSVELMLATSLNSEKVNLKSCNSEL
jgi:hypothetical protein